MTSSPSLSLRPGRVPVRNAHTDAAWHEVHQAACAPYRRGLGGGWAWHWARGKLAHDPVFRGLLERGDLPAQARVLDIGCGQALVASLLHAAAAVAGSGRWPSAWPPAPSASAYTGIEVVAADVARARGALAAMAASRAPGPSPVVPQLVCADLRHAVLPACDVAVILDVLHYVEPAAQLKLLQRVRHALAPRGRLLLRVGDAARQRRFAFSQWADGAMTRLRRAPPPAAGRPLDDWTALLCGLGFGVHGVPMGQGTPFANVLLVADLQPDLQPDLQAAAAP